MQIGIFQIDGTLVASSEGRRIIDPSSADVAVFGRGKGDSPRAPAAGVRKTPRHEIAVGWAPGGAAGSIYGGARAQARFHRIAQLKSLAEQVCERDFNPVELMRGRAEALEERGASTESQNSGGPLGPSPLVLTAPLSYIPPRASRHRARLHRPGR